MKNSSPKTSSPLAALASDPNRRMAGALRSSPGGLAAFKTAGSKSKISKVTEHLAIQRRQSDIKNETNRQKPQSDGGMKSPSGRSSRDSSLESTPIKMIEVRPPDVGTLISLYKDRGEKQNYA